MRNFLLSNAGGAWLPGEILPWDKFTLPGDVSVAAYDFVLFYFAGHGMVQDGDMVLCTDDRCALAVGGLGLPAPRQLVIIDARRVDDPDCPVVDHGVAGFGSMMRAVDGDYRARCRALYDARVMQAAPGRTTVHACSVGQSARDSARTGGHFTRRFVEGAEAWAICQGLAGELSLTATAACLRAAAHLDPARQKPVAEPGRGCTDYPFAVAP